MKHLRYSVTGLFATLVFLVVLSPLILIGGGGAVLAAVLWEDMPVLAVLVGVLTMIAVGAGASWQAEWMGDD